MWPFFKEKPRSHMLAICTYGRNALMRRVLNSIPRLEEHHLRTHRSNIVGQKSKSTPCSAQNRSPAAQHLRPHTSCGGAQYQLLSPTRREPFRVRSVREHPGWPRGRQAR